MAQILVDYARSPATAKPGAELEVDFDAVSHGLGADVDVERDEDFKMLRGDPRFNVILATQRAKRPS